MAESGRRTLALRGSVALAGIVAVAASMSQVVGTVANPVAVRTATLPISTANYFPTPLATNISCTTSGIIGFQRASLSWTAPTPPPGKPAYRYRVVWLLNGTTQKYSFTTSNTTTGTFRIYDHLGIGDSTAETYRIVVHTINPENGNAVSSGSVGWNVYSATTATTRCVGGAGFRTDNQPWENQEAWTPPPTGFDAAPAQLRMFISLAEELSADPLADPLPAEEPMGDLASVAPPTPGTGDSSTDPAATPGTATKTTPETSPSSPDAEVPVPDDSEYVGPPRTSTPATPATTTEPTRRVALGEGPLTVATVQVRLDEVAGQPLVMVTSGGVQVCTATAPGAETIEESDGILTVSGGGRTGVLNTATCEIT